MGTVFVLHLGALLTQTHPCFALVREDTAQWWFSWEISLGLGKASLKPPLCTALKPPSSSRRLEQRAQGRVIVQGESPQIIE